MSLEHTHVAVLRTLYQGPIFDYAETIMTTNESCFYDDGLFVTVIFTRGYHGYQIW